MPGLRDAFIGCAIGDALGAGIEFTPDRRVRRRHIDRELKARGELRVTDDTQMALHFYEAWAGDKDYPRALANWYNDPRNTGDRAPGQACLTAGIAADSGASAPKLRKIADNQFGSGAIMRSCAFFHADDVRELVSSALLSHNHPYTPFSVIAPWLLAREPNLWGDEDALADRLRDFEGRFNGVTVREAMADLHNEREYGGFSAFGVLRDAMQALKPGRDFDQVMDSVLMNSGDVDTAAAVTGSIYGYAKTVNLRELFDSRIERFYYEKIMQIPEN